MNDTVCLCQINTLPHLEINPETKKGAGFFPYASRVHYWGPGTIIPLKTEGSCANFRNLAFFRSLCQFDAEQFAVRSAGRPQPSPGSVLRHNNT